MEDLQAQARRGKQPKEQRQQKALQAAARVIAGKKN